jgi:hypothetical protein
MAAVVPRSTIKYSPLSNANTIRLIRLGQGSDDDPIHCSIFHAQLGNQGYEALSYEWGSPSADDPMMSVDSENIRTRKNLYDALWHIRLADQDRCLWIDAICINQSNVLERNHQVHLMGKIYSQAHRVIAWLGLARNHSDLGMDFLQEWNNSGRTSELWDSKLGAAEMKAISFIATRSYWRRMWIIQETQLASQLSLRCGTRSIPAEALSSYRYRINGYKEAKISSRLGTADTPADFLLQQREKCLQGLPQSNLGPWLTWAVTQESLCTEPRDIVYALLGVAADCQSGIIEPDYTKPRKEVLGEVFQLLSEEEQDNIANHLAIAFGLTTTWRHPHAPDHRYTPFEHDRGPEN